MSEELHSKLGASGAHRWLACPGSVKAEEGIPSKDSPYALEGTFAHELAEICLITGKDAKEFVGQEFSLIKEHLT